MTHTPGQQPGQEPAPDLTVDGTGLLCVQLLLRLRARIADLPAGAVVHIHTTDPAAPSTCPPGAT